jgi:hypothetical protein
MTGRMPTTADVWCRGGLQLVRLLRDTFGKERVRVRSPHYIQVELQSGLHHIWLNSSNVVKYKLAGQSGSAQVASTPQQLLRVISGHEELPDQLPRMRRALDLIDLINSAKAAQELTGASHVVCVAAGRWGNQAEFGVVEISLDADGQHVRVECHPCTATDLDAAEEAAIQYAVDWAPAEVCIFSESRSAVVRACNEHGQRIHWLPPEQHRSSGALAASRPNKRRQGKKPLDKTKPR